jgi:hypothetical protein
MGDSNEPIIIGIIGQGPFRDVFEPVKDKRVKDRHVVVERFEGLEELRKYDKAKMDQTIGAIRKCHVLYICRSEQGAVKEITDLVKGYGVLTVGDMEGDFLESGGGIIHFVLEDDKVRFEINVTAAKETKLQIRSQLLRLAKKVIGEESLQEAKN